MSAWVLALIPLVLFALMWIIDPEYLPMLLNDQLGRQIVMFAVVWGAIGIFFLRKIIRIDV